MSSIAASSPAKRRSLGRLFGDLKVRPKLMVLHNAFFLVLAATVYFALIPPFERQVQLVERQQTHISARSPAQTNAVYHDLVQRARITLFAVLGVIYIMAC